MFASQRVAIQLPLMELFDEEGIRQAHRVGNLAREEIRRLLQTESIQFVVVDVGSRPEWVPLSHRFDFWKSEVVPHLVDEETNICLENYPGHYCYLASEWREAGQPVIVLLERCH